MRPQALALVSFLAAALLCLGAAAASPIMSVAGKFAVEGQCASARFYRAYQSEVSK
jgi:hypothetical protein